MVIELLGCVGRAVLRQSAIDLLLDCLPFGKFLHDIARDALDDWKRRRDVQQRRQEIEALAQMPASKSLELTREAANGVANDSQEREALAAYLNQMPAKARRTLSRPGDWMGRTVPAVLPLDNPDDLVPFLPLRSSPLRPNQEVEYGGNSWKLLEPLGAGGFGEVWRAQSLKPGGVEVALKFCLDPGVALDSLRREVDLLRRLEGGRTGIVPLLQTCLEAQRPFLVFAYISGGDLVRLIQCWHVRAPKAGLVPESIRLIGHLAKILCPAHKLAEPVVHRDLKPSNILLEPASQPRFVWPRISDFGIGGVAAASALERTGTMSANEIRTTSLVGAHTDLYASPQQKEGEPANPADDVYALGVICYQVLLGDTKVGPDHHMDRRLRERQIPMNVIEFLEACLATEVEDRLPNAQAVIEASEALMLSNSQE